MNREIKFRGKSLKYGNWLFGSLWIDKENFYITHEKESEKAGESSYTYVTEVVPSTIGQYTGLKDKNGKEIYEGDMLQHPNHKTTIVTWDETECGWNIVGYGIHLCEVIGNIHDNPELIKQ